jgi:hypothetical protein
MSRIVSFRGQLAGSDTGSSHEIALQTNTGLIGYQIKKFQTIQKSPGAINCEGLVIIWKVEPTAAEIASKTIDLSNNRILGISFYSASATANSYPEDHTIIFDSEKFNQDIYVTYIDVSTNNDPMNYYIELEQMKLDLNEQTVATLKDIRNIGAQ